MVIISMADQDFNQEVQEHVPDDIRAILLARDAGLQLANILAQRFSGQEVLEGTAGLRVWELCGLSLRYAARQFDALKVFHTLYDHLLEYQKSAKIQVHKGTPLVWISDCHRDIGHRVLARRYLMLTLIEDAIRGRGVIPPEGNGVYFRAVWYQGLSHETLTEYAAQVWELYQNSPDSAIYPEWVLQKLDQHWMTEWPSDSEASFYVVSTKYVRHCLGLLGKGDGEALEGLAEYLMSCVPGCRTSLRKRAYSSEHDIICTLEGPAFDFRSELGRYILCECKDWSRPMNFAAFAKFARILESTRCKCGIVLSKKGITGSGRTTDAVREQLKIFQSHGLAILVLNETDLDRIVAGTSLITILRDRYEQVRLDLRPESQKQSPQKKAKVQAKRASR